MPGSVVHEVGERPAGEEQREEAQGEALTAMSPMASRAR